MIPRRNPGFCKAPLCQRTLKGSKGLSTHLKASSSCATWYKNQARDRSSPAPGDVNVELPPDSPVPWSTNTVPTSAVQAAPLRRPVVIEDDSDDDLGVESFDGESSGSKPYIEVHPSAGKTYGKGRTIMEEIFEERSFSKTTKENPYHPFSSKQDFEMAAWLSQSNASMSQIDDFLKLSYVTDRGGLSFRSAQELNKKLAQLPRPPAWKSTVVSVDGGTTKEPLVLFHRDGLELFESLFGNPLFANHQDFVPSKVWADYENDIRIYSGPFTGDLTYSIQDEVGDGETLGLVLLGSNKTMLTNISGDKSTHCVYMSCANIQKDVRSKASARCWVKVAEIPVPKFQETALQKELTQRLYHVCMDIVTKTLKECSHSPRWMTDANGDMRLVRTILFAHLADLPEQLLVACCHAGASPISTARTTEFGSSEKQPARTGISTCQQIRKATATTSPKNIPQYARKAAKSGLNAVQKPYWRNWKFADPSKFLAPDALHQWHKFFWDHIMYWARVLIGDEELNRRYQCLQKHPQHRHFAKGFTTFSQHTCREFRELEASFIAVISGHPEITPGIMACFRSLLEFIYLGQLETHTTETIRQLRSALATFHQNKHHISAKGLRDGPKRNGEFKIPKLELMHHVADFIEQLGSLYQYTTEHTERCHITLAKTPYRFTNKKDYEIQICLFLGRRDAIDLFITYLEWKLSKETGGGRADEVANASDRYLRAIRYLPFARAFIPQPPRNAFLDHPSATPRNETTAFILTSRITHGDLRVSQISRIYRIPKLCEVLAEYYEDRLEGGLDITYIDCWDRVRLQLCKTDSFGGVLPPIPVMSAAPSKKLPLGLCNFVLVKPIPDLNLPCLNGHFVAQLRLVFQPLVSMNDAREADFLAYVEPLQPTFDCVQRIGSEIVHCCEKNSGLFKASRLLDQDGSRRGLVINLTDIWRPIDVVPLFRGECPLSWSTDNAIELSKEFYINPYYEKNSFIDMYCPQSLRN